MSSKTDDTHSTVDEQVAIPTPYVPYIAAEKFLDEWLTDISDVVSNSVNLVPILWVDSIHSTIQLASASNGTATISAGLTDTSRPRHLDRV